MRPGASIQVFVAVMTIARIAAAQVQVLPKAEELFREGVDALHQHDYERARTTLAQSLALAPRGSVLLDLAKAEWALGRHVDAVRHLRAALDRSDLPAGNRASSERGLVRWSTELGHVAVTTDKGASVQVDGAPIDGTAPFAEPIDVEPGVHVIEARVGDVSGRIEVAAKAGAVVQAQVLVVRPSPLVALSAAPAADSRIEIAEARTQVFAPSIAERPPSTSFWNARRAVGAGVAGAGVVSLIVGGVFFAMASREDARATAATSGFGASACTGAARPAACSSQDSAVAAERTDGTMSRVAMAAGVAAVAVGVGAIGWPSSPARMVAMTASPRVGGGELRLEGRF